jgi:hypothetical protein
MRFYIFTAVKMWIVVFWVVTLHSIVGDYQNFRGTYNLYLQGRNEGNYSSEDASSSKMLVTIYKMTWHHNPETHNQKEV